MYNESVAKNETTPKILYIEAHTILRDAFYQLLKFSGRYRLFVAKNGTEGVEKALTIQPDLILMGLKMPGKDGFDVITELRAAPNTAQTPILVLSAWADAKSKKRALAAGANEHITPPVDIFWLIHRINIHLKRKSS